jgi:hypothetical protein
MLRINEESPSEKQINYWKKKQLKSSYSSVRRALKDDIKIKPWKVAQPQNISLYNDIKK